MEGHRLVVHATAADGTVVGGTIVDASTIASGTDAIVIPARWDASGTATRLAISLLSPAGYEVLSTLRQLAAPAPPVITDTIAFDKSLRIRWTDAAGIGSYRVQAITAAGTVTAETTTAESFADLAGLVNGSAYRVTSAQ